MYNKNSGKLNHLDELTVGEFFGEIGIATSHVRNAHVIAKEPVTCFVFSPGKPTKFAGRGEGAVHGTSFDTNEIEENTGQATHVIDVSKFIMKKSRRDCTTPHPISNHNRYVSGRYADALIWT